MFRDFFETIYEKDYSDRKKRSALSAGLNYPGAFDIVLNSGLRCHKFFLKTVATSDLVLIDVHKFEASY